VLSIYVRPGCFLVLEICLAYPHRFHQSKQIFQEDLLAPTSPGFVLLPHRSAVRDFQAGEVVRSQYFAELRTVVMGLTGASHVFFGAHAYLKEAEFSTSPSAVLRSGCVSNYKTALAEGERSVMVKSS
jgi:hypothetical protein